MNESECAAEACCGAEVEGVRVIGGNCLDVKGWLYEYYGRL